MAEKEGADDRAERFRRPPFDPPRPDRDDLEYPAAVPARDPEEMGLSLAPLKDLAEAFQQNSEVLKSLVEGQARLSRRVERSDRSEAVVQSTQALNDTFRGVQRTQETLIGRLDQGRRSPILLAGGLVLVLAALVGGGLWLLFGWLDRREGEDRDGDRQTIAGIVSEHAVTVDDLQRTLRQAEATIAAQNEKIVSAGARSVELSARIEEHEETMRGLRANQGDLERLYRDKATLGAEVSRLTTDYERAQREIVKARERAAELEDQVADLERKLDAMARRSAGEPTRPPPPTETGPTPAASGSAASAPDTREVPAGAVTHAPELTRLAGVLNGLLLDAGGAELYEFERIGGVRGKVLYDVEVANRDSAGREVKRIESAECRVVLDPAQRRVEMRFVRGHIVYYGVKAPFWGGQYVVSIVNADPAIWRRSGLTVLDEMR